MVEGFDFAPLFLPSVGMISPVLGSSLPIRVRLALEHFFSVTVQTPAKMGIS